MRIVISPSVKRDKSEVLRLIVCPDCGEKVKGVALCEESRVTNLLFRCKGCKAYKSVSTIE